MTEQHHGPIANALATLDVVTRGRDEAWLQAHAAQLHKLLEKTLASDQTELLDAARPVLMRLCSILPPTEDESAQNEDVRAFSTAAETAISEGLKNGTGLATALALLDAWSHTHPGVIDRHQLPLIKTLTRLAKEHLSGHGGDAALTHLLRVLTLLRSRISHLGDQRRWFLSAVVQLVEKSPSDKVCAFLLEMMRTWILESREAFPTVKEKAGILVKMLCFEDREASLAAAFMDLILAIYKDPALARTELTARLEPAFLMGCRCADVAVRREFLALFDASLTRSVPARVLYLLGHQNWSWMAEHYWLHQVLDLVLAAVDTTPPLIGAAYELSLIHI